MITEKMKKRLIAGFFMLVVFLILWWQAGLPAWRDHLRIDVVTFYNRSQSFWLHGSFREMEFNEHQPGALLFFLIPILFNHDQQSFFDYEKIFFFLNLFLIWGHLYFYKFQRSLLAGLVFMMMLVFSGPILLFRFELIVSLLTLLSFFCWQQNRQKPALFLLGIAVTIKIYPLLFLPYYLILSKEKLKKLMTLIGSFIVGVFLPVLTTAILGLAPKQMQAALMFHALKPVGIEGFPAMIITFLSHLIHGTYPIYISTYGVNGLAWQDCFFGRSFYNYLWVAPLFLFYGFLWRRRSKLSLDYSVPFLIALLFLIFAKGLNPQYIFWFLLFFPLIKIGRSWSDYFIQLFLVFMIVLLTQYIYPLAYTPFLREFYTYGREAGLFYLNSWRNLLILGLFIILFKNTFYPKQNENR